MWTAAEPLAITEDQRRTLEQWLRAQKTPQQVAVRARIILMAAEGAANNRIAGELGVSRSTVILWRERFAEGGPRALTETAPGRGRKPSISAERIKAIVEATISTTPPGATQWSCRTMAAAQGVSPATVQRIWDAHGLAPHRVRSFKLSRDPHFTEKLIDVVGLYLDPPDKAIVLCVDEKSQIQALDRTQPSLPMKRGRAGTLTHDYKRNGTTTLFAALDLLEGTVIGECHARHRHQEFLAFLLATRPELPDRARTPPHRRQLRHTHPSRRREVARGTLPGPFPHALHPHQLVLAQPRRALVPGAHDQASAARRLP